MATLVADDGKRSELLCTKATERVALDLMRVAALEDRSVSEYLYLMIRRNLYGSMVRVDDAASGLQGQTKVDRRQKPVRNNPLA